MTGMLPQNPPLLPLAPGARSALLIIDMQEFFFRKPERRVRLAETIANINRLSAWFDGQEWPVFHIISCYQPDGSDWDLRMKAAGIPELIAGTAEAATLSQINMRPGHKTLIKIRHSAFFKTCLADYLRHLDAQRVFCCGAYTHYCVNATVFDAYYHDFVPGLITDATTSFLTDESAMLVNRMRRNGFHVMTTAELTGSAGSAD